MLDRRTLLLSGLGLGAGVALFGGSRLVRRSGTPVVLYTSNSMEVVEAAFRIVVASHPELVITQVTGGTGVLMKRIASEAQSPRGDIFWSGGFSTLDAYADHFALYRSDVPAIPPALIQPDGLWTGTNVHVMLVMANRRWLEGAAPPATWRDLFHPRWRGQVAITDPGNSSFAYITIYALLNAFGSDGLARLAANAVVTGTTGQTTRGVAEGEYALGITSEAAAQEYVAGGQPGISLIYPREGVVLSPEGVAMLKNARHPAAARVLYDAFLSREVQEAVLRTTYRRPSRSDIPVSSIVPLPDMASLKVLPADQITASRARDAVLKAWRAAVDASRR